MMSKKIIAPLIAILMLALVPISLAQSTNTTNCVLKVLDRKCVGNYLLANIQNTDCESNWRIEYYCPFGCAYGQCLSEKPLPLVKTGKVYDIQNRNSIIFITVKNIGGTRGTVYIEAEGEAAKWMSLPEKVTLDVNESKDIPIVLNVPLNASGKYSFTIHASGAADFYSPSALVVPGEKSFAISADIRRASLGVSILFIAAVLIIWYYYKRKRKEEILS